MELAPLPQQQRAIQSPLGPVLVVAGPGAGKTFCLIGRINHLIAELGFAPDRILAVTFTNKAAEEIAVRLNKEPAAEAQPRAAAPSEARGLEVKRGTLHALCLTILREFGLEAGLRQGFGIADVQYQRTVLRRLGIHPDRASDFFNLFSRRRLKRERLSLEEERLFRAYTDVLRSRGMIDFDDLICETARLLTARPDITMALAARWDYVLVDEFQDLSLPQYEILTLLTPHKNIFAVGDDEQSIYSWSGADSLVLDRFRRDYAVEPLVLDKNRRCSRQIFETARRVLGENPSLFKKALSADRESEHDVVALAFEDERAEAAWILQDLQNDRAVSGLAWGDYAILYRRHKTGVQLEGHLLGADIKCRVAKGRAVAEDPVVGFVIAALRLIRDPSDDIAVQSFADLLLPEHLLQRIEGGPPAADFLEQVRILADGRQRHEPDTERLWKFFYAVGNLRALPHKYESLGALVDHLLSRRYGRYSNSLEERHEELSDPLESPEAVRLAERLQRALDTEEEISIEPMAGLEIALRGMLIKAGFRHVASVPSPTSTILQIGSALTLFKALQLLNAHGLDTAQTFVAFDLETTDDDVETCDIIEIGAARVRNGAIVDRFHSLVRPTRPISAGASKVHGRTDADVQDAPTFADVWPRFRAFVADALLVAHAGQHFDAPILKRHAGREANLVFYDTLPLARSLSTTGARLVDLAARFGIDPGRSHYAEDDAITLARVFVELERERVVRARKAMLVEVLDWLGLALALEYPMPDPLIPIPEARILREIARVNTLGRYTDCLQAYVVERERTGVAAPPLDEVIAWLGGQELMDRIRAAKDPAQRYPTAVARLRSLMGPDSELPVVQGIERLLERVALSTSEGVEVEPDCVSLLTLHSTKGLEFSRVYVVGVEDFEIPGYRSTKYKIEDEIQEARRLLYVGMTRAKDRLVLTRVDQRFGRDAGGSMLLEEMGLVPSVVTVP